MYIFTDDVFTRAMRFIIPEPPEDVDREKEKIRQEKPGSHETFEIDQPLDNFVSVTSYPQ